MSRRKNIICISDEAHRTQTNTEAKYIISKSDAKKTYGFAKYLRDSFPNATYVGFTGTPIDATLRVFGEVVVQYTMKQSLDDGSTVGIVRLPGPREVQLDEKMAQACDEYYRLQAEAGANEYQIEKSKKDMTNLKVILGNPDRLDIVVRHFIWHYEKRCEEHATVNGKAMFVCYDREIAWMVYKKVKALRPEWFLKRKCAPEYEGSHLDRDAIEIEKIALVCTNGKNDPAEMTAAIGDSRTRKAYARAFKDDKSNLKIAIVVDMWITGFDVLSMDTMYLDKPVETHNLIQTISRVNRVFKGKKEGLIVDYIGLEGAILTAMKLYNGDITPVNGIDTSLVVFKDFLDRTIQLMHGYDYSAFFTDSISSLERLTIIQKGVEYVLSEKARKDNFNTPLLRNSQYRNGAWGISKELSGAISQVQVNCAQWEISDSRTEQNREELCGIYTISPKGIVIVGNTLELNCRDKRNSFERFRQELRSPEIITYDELFERAKYIVNGPVSSMLEVDDDFPF